MMKAPYRITGILALVVLSTLAAGARSELILIDDFNDGNDDGWTRADLTEGTLYGPALMDVNGKGEYRFASGGTVPNWAPYAGAFYSTWNGSTDPQYSDGLVRARMRIGDTSLIAGVLMRVTGGPDDPPSGYMFRVSTREWLPRLFIERLESGEVVQDTLTTFTLHVDEDLMIEAGAVGDHLTLKVWPADEMEPLGPQLEWTDSAFTTGLIGLESNIEDYSTLFNRVDVVFDDVYFTPGSDVANAAVNDVVVPEPAGVVGLILGGACLLIVARRRRRMHHAFQSPVPPISSRKLRTATVAGCALLVPVVFSAGVRGQSAVFDLGSILVNNDAATGTHSLSIPAGTYNAYRLTTDWSRSGGDPWSREALWTVADGALGDPSTHYYANPGKAPNSAGDNSPVQLVWEGLLDIPLSGSRDVSLIALETYRNSRARWGNTVLELSYESPPTAPALDAILGTIAHEFDPLSIVTAGGLDTELAVYSSTGAVLAKNDDAAGPTVNSELRFDYGLPAGDYIAVVGGYNTKFANGYSVTPGAASGSYELDLAGNSIPGTLAAGQVAYVGFSVAVPEPSSALLSLLGLALFLAGPRRRAAQHFILERKDRRAVAST